MKTNYFPEKKMLHQTFKLLFTFHLIFLTTLISAQQKKSNPIVEGFQNYTANYKEIAYSQLNKSTYIKGETLGFSTYIIDKSNKKPSLLTKNLYCVITDKDDKIIKSKLLKVDKGVTYNSFEIDSLFTTGTYTFKAYTNWMKNFNEPNAFIESFKVIDPKKNSFEKRKHVSNLLDVQFLPEGGHFVNNVTTSVGVTIKNGNGYGVSNAVGNVYDANNTLITSFKTNFLGIGKFLLVPKTGQSYIVKINTLNKEYQYTITGVRSKGISIRLNQSDKNVTLELNTNKETLKTIKEQPFKLIIHNGDIIKEGVITFKKTSFVKKIDYKNLLPGINIFTLFDKNNDPILERLFFNYRDINTLSLEKSKISKIGDSLQINIPFSNLSNSPNVSISVLPTGTKSYQKNHNIISYTHLQPYVKGYIENAGYYFTNINKKKKYHLDNLLITQGWSSYDWSSIFKNTISNQHTFENGITIKVNKNNLNNSEFFISPLKLSSPSIIKVQENKKFFIENGLYPIDKEPIKLSALDKKGKLIKPNLYVQFSPNKTPEFKHYLTSILSPKFSTYSLETKVKPFTVLELNQQQELDEIVVKANLKQKRFEELRKQHILGRVYQIESSKQASLTLAEYINFYVPAFSAYEYLGKLVVINQARSNSPTALFVDDLPVRNHSQLYGYRMLDVDYIVTNTSGMGEVLKDAEGAGSLKIYTKTTPDYVEPIENSRTFKFPLSFSKNKKFYAPKYHNYHNSFYKDYGVIDWIPNCKIENGNLSFKIHNPANTNITLFIEGISKDGKYLTTTKNLTFNKF